MFKVIFSETGPDRHRHHAFLHYSDMVRLGLRAGLVARFRVIETPQTYVDVIVWPSSAVAPETIQIRSTDILGMRVEWVENYPDALKHDVSLTIYVSSVDDPEGSVLHPTVRVALCNDLVEKKQWVRYGEVLSVSCLGKTYRLEIQAPPTKCNDLPSFIWIRQASQLNLQQAAVAVPDLIESTTSISQRAVYGLDREKEQLEHLLRSSLFHQDWFLKSGLTPPKGVLIYGPSGVGKTSLVHCVTAELHVRLIPICVADLVVGSVDASVQALKEAFQGALQSSKPTVLFLDAIDQFGNGRNDESSSLLDKRLLASLYGLIDSLGPGVLVVGATHQLQAVDVSLRQPGRLDKELSINVPEPASRLAILRSLTEKMETSLTQSDLETIASISHGYVGADLQALCREATLSHFLKSSSSGVEGDPNEAANSSLSTTKKRDRQEISLQDFLTAMKQVRPSVMRDALAVQVEPTDWDDIGGQEEAKRTLEEFIVWPLRHQALFKRMGMDAPKGLLLYGPPGNAKTMLARAVATHCGLNFLAVKGPDIFRKYVGESEQMMRQVFTKARAASPCVIFFDEIDAIAARRAGMGQGSVSGGGGASVGERVLTQLLVEMDGVEPLSRVVLIAATNRPDILDPALLRPGRLDRLLYIGPPDAEARRSIFKRQFRKMPVASDVSLDELVEKTQGLSGAEVVAVCREAAMQAMKSNPASASHVAKEDFEVACRQLQSSGGLTEASRLYYERMQRTYSKTPLVKADEIPRKVQ